jgi:hypothetical protein
MAEGMHDGSYEGFLPLRAACARVYRAVTGRGPQGTAQWDADLDTVAFSLCTLARIYATDPLTKLLFPVSAAELMRGRFHDGAEHFVLDGEARYAGLHVPVADLEDAIRLLASARTQSPLEPPPTRA